jgi:hypothetical protein
METTRPASDALPTQAPLRLVNLEVAGLTDVGCQREYNQDYFYAHTTMHRRLSPQGELVQGKGLYVLCDGMGGHAGGDEGESIGDPQIGDLFAGALDGGGIAGTGGDPGGGGGGEPGDLFTQRGGVPPGQGADGHDPGGGVGAGQSGGGDPMWGTVGFIGLPSRRG